MFSNFIFLCQECSVLILNVSQANFLWIQCLTYLIWHVLNGYFGLLNTFWVLILFHFIIFGEISLKLSNFKIIKSQNITHFKAKQLGIFRELAWLTYLYFIYWHKWSNSWILPKCLHWIQWQNVCKNIIGTYCNTLVSRVMSSLNIYLLMHICWLVSLGIVNYN